MVLFLFIVVLSIYGFFLAWLLWKLKKDRYITF